MTITANDHDHDYDFAFYLLDCPECGGYGGDHGVRCEVCNDKMKVQGCTVCGNQDEVYKDCEHCRGTAFEDEAAQDAVLYDINALSVEWGGVAA